MEQEISKYYRLRDLFLEHGQEVVQALIILVLGILAIKYIVKYVRKFMTRLGAKPPIISTVSVALAILLFFGLAISCLEWAGMRVDVLMRFLAAACLGAIAIWILARPYIPSLPFKVGNTVEAGGLLGVVEGTTMIHTRLRTFDGKTVFVPNSKILKENVVNYHYTPNRQVRLVIGIHYGADLVKAKRILADLLAEDPRVLNTPPARVFVLNLAESCVEIAARPWVNNKDYWITRCDLLEKIKLRFDQEGVTIAFPQVDAHVYYHREPEETTD